jgi:hypothetical protein
LVEFGGDLFARMSAQAALGEMKTPGTRGWPLFTVPGMTPEAR